MGVQAATIGSEQKQALIQTIEAFNQKLGLGDTSPLVEAMPPRIYEKMASHLQKNIEALQADFASNVQKQFDDDGLKNYHFNVAAIAYHQTKTGDFYALVPTKIETRDIVGEFQTLAVYDQGRWYLIQGGQKTVQNPVFLEIYPYLAEITIPPAQIIKNKNQK